MPDAYFRPNRCMVLRVKILASESPIHATTDLGAANFEIRSFIDYNYLRSLAPEGPSLLENSIVTPTPPCSVVNGTRTDGGERVIGMLSRRLKISLWLKEKAGSTFENAQNVKYPTGWLDMKVQNVLVVQNLPVPFHLSLKGANMVVPHVSGTRIQASHFPPSYANHIYWQPSNVHYLPDFDFTKTEEIRNGATGHATKAYVCCTFCGHKKANYVCSRCKSEWYCSKACQIRDWKRHKIDCASS